MRISLEARKKISKKLTGIKRSKETRKKMSIAVTKAYKEGRKKLFGNENPSWKGGVLKRMGYVYIYKRESSMADKDGYVKRANLVWFEKTGEIIKMPFLLHHKNGIKTDDRFENLQKMDRESHARHHILLNHPRKNEN